MRIRLTTEPDGAVCLESPYDRSFVEGLKSALDYGGRSWDQTRKRWLVSALYVNDLLAYLQQVGAEVQDDRERQGQEAEKAAIPPMPEELRAAFDILYLQYTAPLGAAEAVYKFLVRHSTHEDIGGTVDIYALNDAIATVRRYLTLHEEEDDDEIPF